MKAVMVRAKNDVVIDDVPAPGPCGPADVRVRIATVGICGSDIHYVTHGRIGPYVVHKPMILGHEAAGVIVEIGSAVDGLAVGDRVCMEPGIPNPHSRASRLGIYNVDPDVVFWATPPIDGCLVAEVVHPAAFTYRLPDHVLLAEGALMEPLSIGLQAATKARLRPGDTTLVIGSGTIGLMTALAALAGGAARVIISDVAVGKLAVAGRYEGITTVDIGNQDLGEVVRDMTRGWGANVVFEASGNAAVYPHMFANLCPGGAVVLVGTPVDPVPLDVAAAQAKEARIETVFRYANIFDRAIDLVAAGKIDLKPLLSATYPFDRSVEAFDRAIEGRPGDIKIQIELTADS